MMSRVLPVVALTALVAMAACGEKKADKKAPAPTAPVAMTARDCFPEASRRWIPIESDATPAATARGEAATIYVDASGSMAGYLRGGRRGERPFEELVNDVPGSVGADASALSYVMFGRELRPISGASIDTLSQVATYACGRAADCDNQESRLDAVLNDIAAKTGDHLAVVVTDLWLSNSELTTSGSTALNTPIRRLMDAGKSIVVYGLEAPYQGAVYDLPGGRTDVTASRRPLYLVAIGSSRRLNALDDSLRQSPSPYIHQAFSGGTVRRALFTRTPETRVAAEPVPFEGRHPALRSKILLTARQGLRIQQLELSRGAARQARIAAGRPGAPQATTPAWTGPSAAAIAPGAVWTGPLEVRTRIWRQKRDEGRCRASDWEDAGRLGGGWRPAAADGERTFALDPADLADQLNPGTYLIVGEVARTTLTRNNPATEWMRDWSFSPANEADVLADAPSVFPTLNLSETARLLENALAASGSGSQAVAGFSVVIEVKN